MSLAAQIEAARLRSEAQQATIAPPNAGRGVSFSPTQQFRPAPRPAPERPNTQGLSGSETVAKWREHFEAKRESEQQNDSRGVLGTILNNPVTRAATKPLEVLDYGRRLAVLGIEEYAKAAPEWLEWMTAASPMAAALLVDEDREDDRSNWDKLGDASYGFGQVSKDTGNVWADRAIGFAGDVAFDPLTYLTLGSAKFAGSAGRATAASKLAQAGHVDEAKRVGRLGVSALDDELRRTVLNDPAGWRFMGQRVAGTGKVSQVGGAAANQVRARIGDTWVGRMREIKDIKTELRILNGREAGDVVAASARILAHNEGRIGRGAAAAPFRNRVKSIRKQRHAERVNLTHAREAGEANELGELADAVFDSMESAGVSGVQRRSNYVMHLPTRKGAKLLGRLADEGQVVVNTAESTGRAFERAIVPGTTIDVNGTRVTFESATIKEINDKLEPVVGFKVYEDDAAVLAEAMVQTSAIDIGNVIGQKAIVRDFPQLAQMEADAMVPSGRTNPDLLAETIDPHRAERDVAKSAAVAASDGIEAPLKGARNVLQDLLGQRLDEAQGIVDSIPERNVRLPGRGEGVRGAGIPNWRQRREAGAQARRAEAEKVVERTQQQIDALRNRNLHPDRKSTQSQAFDELRTVAATFDGSPEMSVVMDLLDDVAQRLDDARFFADEVEFHRDMIDAGKRGELGDVFEKELADGFERISSELFAEGQGVVMAPELKDLYMQARRIGSDPQVWQIVDDYTKLFKAWATATPGFHTRNAVSAIWMNWVAGVGAQAHLDAIPLYRSMRKDPERWFAENAPKAGEAASVEWQAMLGALGSGMGGRVGMDEIGSLGSTQMGPRGNALLNNMWLEFNRELGEGVEGVVRLAMALDTVRNRGSAVDAMQRVTRYQFDYSQISEFDRRMKWIVPFWTFLSRSLPLQLHEQWMRPGKFAAFDSAVRNVRDDDAEGELPSWMVRQGGFKVADNKALVPDFPHLDVQEQMEYFSDPVSFLANTNPLMRVPTELALDKQFFRDRPFYEDESKPWYVLNNMVPLAGQANRLSGGALQGAFGEVEGAERRRDQLRQAWLNYFGVPYRDVA